MISPAHLRARREALGVTRETVAAFSPSGTKATDIRDLERPRAGRWHRWHVDALDKIEAWFEEHSKAVEVWIWDAAHVGTISDAPVLWIYSQEAFERCSMSQTCKGVVDLYNVCRLNVRAELVEDGVPVIDAEFIPDAFDQFRQNIGSDSHHPELMAKWWRSYVTTYRVEP